MAALLTSLIFSFLFGNWFIQKSSQFFKSGPREHTPENHQKKGNMPSMGGIFILANVLISILLWNNLSDIKVWLMFFCLVIFGLIGLLDDINKIKKKKGISARGKFLLQAGSAALIIIGWLYLAHPETTICFPFFKHFQPNIGLFIIPWAIFIIVGCSNAVNLTDGLDGLAISSLILNFMTFALISYFAGNIIISTYLNIPFAACAELTIIGGSLIGASLGFLWYNTYPAQIFMGDVGALSLGAGLGLMALMTKQEILLIISGGLFVMETLSVIIQVLSFRYLKRRMFKMAPLHHHFELMGWPESKITVRFAIISIILCMVALMTLKMR
ncbi:MAG: phospho-N-acetylmuramoyl-pentapeptide-transferase [Candidatus Babeliales bacterium]|nr:phospho-N-acetylmuramoyl-pentapeptide-transferase [Candidatus Babeliales bacterium]